MLHFPIDKIKDELFNGLAESSNIIIKASPGSGKTTRVPLFLKEKTDKLIIILEPRKIAAKWAAEFVAQQINESVSQSVGYRYRFENKTSEQTQIMFLTEGTFIRLLQDQSFVEKIGYIVFDEFHERHLSTDQALAFSQKIIETQPIKRVFMSATLDSSELEDYLGHSVVILQNDNLYPLKINYLDNNSPIIRESKEFKILFFLEEALNHPGDILVFLEGISEINSVKNKIFNFCESKKLKIHILHSQNTSEETTLALNKGPSRKVILATNIAESSLTIDGVQIVIDSGTHKEKSFDHLTLLDKYSSVKTTQANSIQRSGRANRQASGIVYRLFSEQDFLSRKRNIEPEILRSNLSELIYDSYKIFNDFKESWLLTKPLYDTLFKSHFILESLKIISNNSLTELGKKLILNPFHPRIAVMTETFLQTKFSQSSKEIKRFVATLSKLIHEDHRFENLLHQFILSQLNLQNKESIETEDLDYIFFIGFSDLVSKLKMDQHPAMINHRSGQVFRVSSELITQLDSSHEYWCIIEVNQRNEVSQMIPISLDWIFESLKSEIIQISELKWNELNQISKVTKTLLGSLCLKETKLKLSLSALNEISKAEQANLFKIYYQEKINFFKGTQSFYRVLRLAEFLNIELQFDFLDPFIEMLLDVEIDQTIQDVLELQTFELIDFFTEECLKQLNLVDDHFDLNRDLPLNIKLHDKRTIAIDYSEPRLISVTGFIQDFYGLSQTPILFNGKIPLSLNLLGPHKRVLQRTNDLNSFWNNAYRLMLKELQRDYPKHYWPENPKEAKPILFLKNVAK